MNEFKKVDMESMKYFTSNILMIRPACFGSNPETAVNNTFQARETGENADKIQEKAVKEFDQMVEALRNSGIEVKVIDDTEEPRKPDAVFPNNWITTHLDGSLVTYPMFSRMRRLERREDIIHELEEEFEVLRRYSFEQYEEKGKYLEGTGSLVLDRENKVAYACLSPRTDIELLNKFGVLKGYRIVYFQAKAGGVDIYHTNVLMALGHNFVLICTGAIPDDSDRAKLEQSFEETGKRIIEISLEQMHAFAGNMLVLKDREGQAVIVMSDQARKALNKAQHNFLERNGRIVSSPIETIEKYGGGSARCMIAEIFLNPKS